MTLLEREPAKALQAGRSPVLRTGRLVLRAPRPADAEAITALINDRRIAENTARIPHPYTLEDAEAFIENAAGKPLFADRARRRAHHRRLRHRTLRGADPEIGYWIGVPHWGNGYATEAARALIDHCLRRTRP